MKRLLLTTLGCLLLATATAQQQDAKPAKHTRDCRTSGAAATTTPQTAANPASNPVPQMAASQAPASQVPAIPAQPAAQRVNPDEKPGPRLHLEETVWNFGDVPRKGGDVWHDFTFRNEGSTPLVVLRVITSCSCVKASFPKRPVAAGDTGVIRITYEPHKSQPGTFNKVIRILSNSTAGSDILTVQGTSLEEPPKVKVRNEKIKIKH